VTSTDPLTVAEQIRAELTTYTARVHRNHTRELVIAVLCTSSFWAGVVYGLLAAVYW